MNDPRIPPESDPALSYKQCAKELGIGERTVRRRVKEGLLQKVRLSARRVGIRRSDLKRYLDSCRNLPTISVAPEV
jgi:excisionase family DNA binding protein